MAKNSFDDDFDDYDDACAAALTRVCCFEMPLYRRRIHRLKIRNKFPQNLYCLNGISILTGGGLIIDQLCLPAKYLSDDKMPDVSIKCTFQK